MTGEPSGFDPQGLWQSQKKEHDPMTLADIHAKARRFEAGTQRRNAIEYIACGVVIVGFAPMLLNPQSWMMQAGAALIMLAVVFVAWQLHRRGSVEATPQPGETLVDSYRRQLTRQRDAIRTVGLWYIAPLVPGMTLLMLGRWFQSHAHGRSIGQDHAAILISVGLTTLVFLGVWMLNLHGAKRLQKRIDEL
jgi:hypothetical protein